MKVMNKNLSSVEEVVDATKNYLSRNGFKNEAEISLEIKNFLEKRDLKKVAVNSRENSHSNSATFYIRFSFDDSIEENAIIRRSLKKH